MDIRPEHPKDLDVITRLTKAAFEPMPFSEGNEAEALAKLREDGDLTLSLVAIEGEDILGHIAFSPVYLDDVFSGWYGLGPVSVWPHVQRNGIGGELIRYGLVELQGKGAHGCVLIGDPRYYQRFGFVGDGSVSYRDLPKEVVQWLTFSSGRPSGLLRFSPGLE
jgi:putative acetyltransferase